MAEKIIKYSSAVRIGLWQEEILIEQDKLLIHLRKKRKNQLLIQKMRELFCNLLKEVELAPSVQEHLRFGQIVQIVAPDIESVQAGNLTKKPIVLSMLVSDQVMDTVRKIFEGCDIVGSYFMTPCVRNTFIVKSIDPKNEGDPMKYGDKFLISPVETLDDRALYVESDALGLYVPIGKCGFPALKLVNRISRNCYWKAVPWQRNLRDDMIGMQIVPGAQVLIQNAVSNKNLAVEPKIFFQTYFGMECETSVHSLYDGIRNELKENLWQIITQYTRD